MSPVLLNAPLLAINEMARRRPWCWPMLKTALRE